MSQNYMAIIRQDGGWWVGWSEEVPGVNCQERSRDELLESLRITLGEALDMNRGDAKQAVGKLRRLTKRRELTPLVLMASCT